AGIVAVGLPATLVLALQYPPGPVTQADQGGQALGRQRAVGAQRRAAIDHRNGLPAQGLADRPIPRLRGGRLAHEEAALGDMALGGRRYECRGGWFRDGSYLKGRK